MLQVAFGSSVASLKLPPIVRACVAFPQWGARACWNCRGRSLIFCIVAEMNQTRTPSTTLSNHIVRISFIVSARTKHNRAFQAAWGEACPSVLYRGPCYSQTFCQHSWRTTAESSHRCPEYSAPRSLVNLPFL